MAEVKSLAEELESELARSGSVGRWCESWPSSMSSSSVASGEVDLPFGRLGFTIRGFVAAARTTNVKARSVLVGPIMLACESLNEGFIGEWEIEGRASEVI